MLLRIYNDNPNPRDVRRVADCLREGGIAVLPTDTLYAFVCSMEYKKAVETIALLKGYKLKQAKYSMLCASISQFSEYVRPMSRDLFALIKQCLPGPYTFIMEANGNVPRNYQNANKTIGLRVPDNAIVRAVIEELGCPLVSTSVRLVNEEQEDEYLTDPELMHDLFASRVDMVVDGGMGDTVPSTVVDCSADEPVVTRRGKGDIDI